MRDPACTPRVLRHALAQRHASVAEDLPCRYDDVFVLFHLLSILLRIVELLSRVLYLVSLRMRMLDGTCKCGSRVDFASDRCWANLVFNVS